MDEHFHHRMPRNFCLPPQTGPQPDRSGRGEIRAINEGHQAHRDRFQLLNASLGCKNAREHETLHQGGTIPRPGRKREV